MTHIADPSAYPSKKSLIAAIKADPSKVYLDDPSIFSPVSGYVSEIIAKKGYITVTNHPKRSWFAEVKTDAKGNIVAK